MEEVENLKLDSFNYLRTGKNYNGQNRKNQRILQDGSCLKMLIYFLFV